MRWPRVARASSDNSDLRHAAGDDYDISDDILASALEDLEAGMTPREVLARYPQSEGELAPLLQTAYALRTVRWPSMSMTGRVAGRERMHEALATQKRRKVGLLSPLWRQVGVSLALLVMGGAAFLASPLSPLDFRREAGAVTATPNGDALPVFQPTMTVISPLPTASATVSPTVTEQPTQRPRATAEPTETPEHLVLSSITRAPSATPAPTRTRPAPATPTASATAAATLAASATSAPTQDDSRAATPAPRPTIAPPTATATSTRVRPTPTLTRRPTDSPEPTATATKPPAPTATNTQSPVPPTLTPTRRPTITPVTPTATPVPPTATATPRSRRTPVMTVEPTKTPRRTDAPGALRPAPASEIRREIAGEQLPAGNLLPVRIRPRRP